VIFDNLESLKDIEEILPATNVDSHILVTSRKEQSGFNPIALVTLTPEQGLQLLLQEAERQPQNEDESLAATSIVEQLDGLPLALELAGAYLRRRASVGWQQYLALLQDNLQAAFPRFLQNESLTRHEADIYSTLKIHEDLFKEEPLLKEILDVLTWSGPAAMSVSLLCTLLAQDRESNLTGALPLGCALRILQKSNNGEAYAIHRLVREVRRAEFPLEQRTDWAETCSQRLGDWFEKHRDDFHDLPLFEANFDHLQAWQQHAWGLNLSLSATRLLWLQAYPAWHWGRYREAKQYLKQAQELYAHSAQDDVLKAHLLHDLGAVMSALGYKKQALVLSEEAYNLRFALFGEENKDTALSLGSVASLYGSLGNTPRALELAEQALRIMHKLFGEEHPGTAPLLGHVSSHYKLLGETPRALELGEQALRVHRKLFGEEYPGTASSLGNIASCYNASNDTSHALEFGEKALRIQRKLFGEEHPKTASLISNIALYYNQAGDLKSALELGKQAWLIRQKIFGDEHPDTVGSNYNFIAYLGVNNQRPEAFQRLQNQLALLKKDHPHYERLMQLRERLLSKPLQKGFRQPSKHSGKNKPKKRR